MTTATKPKVSRVRTWSAKQIYNINFKEIPISERFQGLLGKPTFNFSTLTFGKAKNGKSPFLLQLAQELADHGRVLYVASEEMISKTLQENMIRNKINHKNIRFIPVRGVEALEHHILRIRPKFIIIDSIQVCEIGLKDFKRLKIKVFKNRKSWHLISQTTNSGKMKCDQGFLHEVDVKIEVIEGVAKAAGRFESQGKLVVFKKKSVGQSELPLEEGVAHALN